ncbi:hypothetical protein BC332_27532 [Capsicum chinense]|nr:hypothetical protein BC332_27532 [Capsicum chinense]
MAGTASEFAITTKKKKRKRPPLATDSIQGSCQRRMQETRGFGYDILFEILVLLPAKSLLRFRSVSRTWNSLIRDDPDFVKLHSALSQSRPLATRLLFELALRSRYQRDDVESTYNSPTQLEGFPLQLVYARQYLDSREKEIVICSNHCNGLVCDGQRDRVSMVVASPGERVGEEQGSLVDASVINQALVALSVLKNSGQREHQSENWTVATRKNSPGVRIYSPIRNTMQ